MRIYLSIVAIGLYLASCRSGDPSSSQAQRIIDQAIATHGGDALEQVHISFNFRQKHYEVQLDGGAFTYESTGEDSTGRFVRDVLTNETFTREVDGQVANLDDEDEAAARNALNSVVYFVLLPAPLNDPAANKTYLGEATVRGEPYHKIKVTFDPAGGGDDFDDEFVYWIHQDNSTMDYLAYEFHVNGGGTRFREAYNVRDVQGIRFVDYINYESTVGDFALEDYDTLFDTGKVEELSRIETRSVAVQSENV